ncbi:MULTISPECIES: lipopolysaccharide kinase InaA family protein [unclassified Endozoicomonas]|uniref:lipopolysaccharide kinase InaA family protein n=1 Tax=unclassified Endozoicomonas TaxID=2644528 RepID=UPI0021472701|nr:MULTISPECIES: lipopolysaccharide kinase InaA family protein [unclassified Endozoicomonas]
MPPNRFVHGQTLPILLALLLSMQTAHSFSSENCQTGPCSRPSNYLLPLTALTAAVITYYAWPERLGIPVAGDDESCNIQPFELWKPKLDSEFCQSLISSKNGTEALKLLKKTGVMQPGTMACNDWQAHLADYFNWRWPGNSASQWQQIPVHHGKYQQVVDTMDEAGLMGIISTLYGSPSVHSLNTIWIDGQQYILKGYVNSGFIIAPMLKVAECYFVPEEEPLALGFDEWSGLVAGRMHSLFKAVKGRSLADWVAESREPSGEVDINALFSGFGKVLAQFHLRHRDLKLNGLYTLSRAVHQDLNFKNIFYDEESGFSLIDTIGLSDSVLESKEVFLDLKRLFGEMDKSRISRDAFIRAYVDQWPEDARENLLLDIKYIHTRIR